MQYILQLFLLFPTEREATAEPSVAFFTPKNLTPEGQVFFALRLSSLP
jgi:hypothetical protein